METENGHIDAARAVGLAEGYVVGTEAEIEAAWNQLVSTGIVWSLQGWFQRTAIELMAQGKIDMPENMPERAQLLLDEIKSNARVLSFMNG